MNQEERLKYCKLCQNQSFDFQQGLLCKLTSEKPYFEGTCKDYLEDPIERRNYEANLLYDTAGNTRLFENRLHLSSNWINALIIPYLPYAIKIYKINPIQLFVIPLITLLALMLTVDYIVPFMLTIVIGGALIVLNSKAALKGLEVVIELDGVSIKTSNVNIYWSDVTLIYIDSNIKSSSLMVETLSNKESIKIPIDDSYGSFVIQTLVESFRERHASMM